MRCPFVDTIDAASDESVGSDGICTAGCAAGDGVEAAGDCAKAATVQFIKQSKSKQFFKTPLHGTEISSYFTVFERDKTHLIFLCGIS